MFETKDIEERKERSRKSLLRQGMGGSDDVSVAEARLLLEEEKLYRGGIATIKDLIAPSAIEVQPTFVRLNGQYVRTIFVISYPRYISVGWFAPIININYTLDISMFFYPMSPEIVLKQLKNKVGVLEQQIVSDAEKGAPRDPLRETALRDIEKLRDDLTQGIEHFFQFALYVTIYADSEAHLEQTTSDIEAQFASKLVFAKRVFYQSEQGLNSTFPLLNDEIQIASNMNSSPIASSFPFISADLSSDNGILYGINRQEYRCQMINRSEEHT